MLHRNAIELARAVYLGPTAEAVERLGGKSMRELLALVATLGALIGLSLYLVAPEFSLVRIAYNIFSGAILLTGICIIWSGYYAWVTRSFSKRRVYYPLFFGSTVFLLPAAVPLVGPFLIPALLIGWTFILAKYCAFQSRCEPGLAFLYLAVPPAAFCALLTGVFYLTGTLISMTNESRMQVPIP